MQSPGCQPTLCVAWYVWLVICKFRNSMVMHDTECPYGDQVSLNNTKPNQTEPASWTMSYLFLYSLIHQVKHQTTSEMSTQLGDCKWLHWSSSGVCMGLPTSVITPVAICIWLLVTNRTKRSLTVYMWNSMQLCKLGLNWILFSHRCRFDKHYLEFQFEMDRS